MSADRISLTVPSRPEYAKAVRMTASALASRMGATYEDLDDIRIAAEELFVYACDQTGTAGDVAMVFIIGEGDIAMSVRLAEGVRATGEDVERRAAYATFILQAVSDHYELSSDSEGRHLMVRKRLGVEPDDAGS
ncbi:MAG TPA: hypothetical protein VFH17_07425 [Coriobacteriia bacterium]|nr:hypothetical protein [Coriobacteriia bacterium]